MISRRKILATLLKVLDMKLPHSRTSQRFDVSKAAVDARGALSDQASCLLFSQPSNGLRGACRLSSHDQRDAPTHRDFQCSAVSYTQLIICRVQKIFTVAKTTLEKLVAIYRYFGVCLSIYRYLFVWERFMLAFSRRRLRSGAAKCSIFQETVVSPAQALVETALNRWSFRQMRADNTSVIVVIIERRMIESAKRKSAYCESWTYVLSCLKLYDA